VVLALELADVGIGAVVGAVISGVVLLVLDQRRRSWEKKTRFLETKQRAYEAFLRFTDLMVSDLLLLAEFWRVLPEWKEGEEVDPAEVSKWERLFNRLEANVAKYEEHQLSALTELTLLAPTIGDPAGKIAKVLRKMLDALAADEGEKVAALEEEYRDVRTALLVFAQRDLGVRA
jgi:hypothetical protein